MKTDYPSLCDEAARRFQAHPTWKMLRHTPWENDAPIIAAELAKDAVASAPSFATAGVNAVAACLERVKQLESAPAPVAPDVPKDAEARAISAFNLKAADLCIPFRIRDDDDRQAMRAALAAYGPVAPGGVTVSDDQVEAALAAHTNYVTRFREKAQAQGIKKIDDARMWRWAMKAALSAALSPDGKVGEGWVACSERMPELYQTVIAVMEVQGVSTVRALTLVEEPPMLARDMGKKRVSTWQGLGPVFYPEVERVTHWRPLPPPPTKAQDGGKA